MKSLKSCFSALTVALSTSAVQKYSIDFMSQVPYKLEISRKKQKQNTKKQTKRDFIWAFPYKNEPKCLTALVLRPTVSAEKQDFKDFIWESYCKVEKNLIGKGPHTHSSTTTTTTSSSSRSTVST